MRAAHPAPRLTLAAATQIADKEEEMVTTDATLLELNERAPEVKNRVKARVKDVERLKVKRVAKEDELPRTQRLEEDRRWPELHDWCVPSPTEFFARRRSYSFYRVLSKVPGSRISAQVARVIGRVRNPIQERTQVDVPSPQIPQGDHRVGIFAQHTAYRRSASC